jgi:NAD(P)-dependent dehydrogenase (short-subunit alcohol dehydrogenase family)
MPRTVFITGASSGIGAAIAAAYAREGATLGLHGRREGELRALGEGLGVPHSIHLADVADIEAMARVAQDFMARHGPPDIVIANAGISIGTRVARREDVAPLARVMAVNVVGVAATLQPFVPGMKARGQGVLVAIASVAGLRGFPGAGAYSASKAAVIAYMESARVELCGTGLRAVTICPGYIDTPMTRGNPYPMPFLLSADAAGRRMVRAIDSGRRTLVVPWQMGVLARLLRHVPAPLFERAFARAPTKRRTPPG